MIYYVFLFGDPDTSSKSLKVIAKTSVTNNLEALECGFGTSFQKQIPILKSGLLLRDCLPQNSMLYSTCFSADKEQLLFFYPFSPLEYEKLSTTEQERRWQPLSRTHKFSLGILNQVHDKRSLALRHGLNMIKLFEEPLLSVTLNPNLHCIHAM